MTQMTLATQYESNAGAFLDEILPQIRTVALKSVEPARFAAIALNAFQNESKLMLCTTDSVIKGVLTAAMVGLDLDGFRGHAWLLPFKTKGVMMAQFIPGYKGYVHLGYQSDRVTKIQGHVVRKGDQFTHRLGAYPVLEHTPRAKSSAEITHAYAVCHMKDGGDPLFQVIDREEIDRRRNRSKAPNSPAWANDFEAMSKKSAVRALAPWIPSPSIKDLASIEESFETHGTTYIDPETKEAVVLKDLGAVEVKDSKPKAAQRKSAPAKKPKAAKKPPADEQKTYEMTEAHRELKDAIMARVDKNKTDAIRTLRYLTAQNKDGELVPGHAQVDYLTEPEAIVALSSLLKISAGDLKASVASVMG